MTVISLHLQRARQRHFDRAQWRVEKMRHQRDRALTRGRWTQEEIDAIREEASRTAAALEPLFE